MMYRVDETIPRMRASLTLEAALVLPLVSAVLMVILLLGMYVADAYRIHAIAEGFNEQMTQELKICDASQWQSQESGMDGSEVYNLPHASQLVIRRLQAETQLSQKWEARLDQAREGKL